MEKRSHVHVESLMILFLSFQNKSSSRVGDMGPLTLYTIYVAPASLVEYWKLATTRAESQD